MTHVANTAKNHTTATSDFITAFQDYQVVLVQRFELWRPTKTTFWKTSM